MDKTLKTVRVTVAYPKVHVANPAKNFTKIQGTINSHPKSDVILLPELCITGYTCGDLFNQSVMLEDALHYTRALATSVDQQVVILGLPFAVNHTLYNCAAILNRGKIVGIVPKSFLPNYREFYESRWFYPAPPPSEQLVDVGYDCKYVPFGTDILFRSSTMPELVIGVEICEDGWAPISPSSFQAIEGATLLCNLSASNETVAKADYRREMVKQLSGRLTAAYAYCSSGPTESTTDLVFGGHCLIAENGSLLVETERFKTEDSITVDVDVEKLVNERRGSPTFNDSKKYSRNNFRTVYLSLSDSINLELCRKINPRPFVPSDPLTLKARCEEIFNIQTCALAKRMEQVQGGRFTIGVSGGLDSTLALLVAVKAAQRNGYSLNCIDAITMPGFGTSDQTLNNAKKLMTLLGVSQEEIDIKPLCMRAFYDVKHNPFGTIDIQEMTRKFPLTLDWNFDKELKTLPADAKDVTFENVQARIRTFLLMSRGFVLGTGDLSEAAQGWCTYNGDHMSMYNVNCSIPKTLVKFLVEYVANHDSTEEVKEVLLDIVNTVVSPELLPLGDDGKIVHSTESLIGPYELHDFFLIGLTRNGFSPKKIAILAKLAFEDKYTSEEIKKWLSSFLKKFFFAQFKRSCVPDGPKVGSVSLSPRGDWRMPSDAESEAWLKDIR